MALLHASIMSQSLMRTVDITVILPCDKLYFPGMEKREDKPYKTLYLLHGIFGSHVDYISGTRIQRWAEEHNLVVVIPSGDNSMYLDFENSHNYYGEFVGKELVEITRKMFPLSNKREDTFIGGLSMGAYGALRNGLKYSDTFGFILSLSAGSALDVENILARTNENPVWFMRRDFGEYCFKDLEKLETSDMNVRQLIKDLLKENKEIPMLYLAIGDKDSYLESNKKFVEFLKENHVPHVFEIGLGAHEWDFWDTYLKKAIYEWLPTEKNEEGIHSGNVGI